MELFPPIGPLAPYSFDMEGYDRKRFLNSLNENALCIEDELRIETSLLDFLDEIKKLIHKSSPLIEHVIHQGIHHGEYSILAADEQERGQLLVHIRWQSDGDIDETSKGSFSVAVTGLPDPARKLVKMLRETYPERHARVRWWFMSGDKAQSHDVVLDKPSKMQPEYYPFFGEDPNEFLKRFVAHEAPILFLSGPPGTGKTTLLRNFLFDNRLRAVVTYEDVLFSSDQMFVDFVTSTRHDVMIIEDADVMLGSREHTGNKMIARFLNASDGIIQIKNKKIIFTTNLSNFNEIDEALVRPGRAFDAVQFRELNPEEATIAAFIAGIKDFKKPKKPITLAEVFNPVRRDDFGKRVVGFVKV